MTDWNPYEPDGRHYILDPATREVKRVSVMEWAQWFETADRHVQHTELENGFVISTVFLGIDHSFGHGPRELFESAMDVGEGWDVVARYANIDEAEDGHARIVRGLLELYENAAEGTGAILDRIREGHNHD